MPEINLFNGGINTHKDSHKLESNESVSITNAVIDSGSLVSIQQPITRYLGVGSVIAEFNRDLYYDDGPYLSFAEQQGRLFKVDGDLPTYTIGDTDDNGNTVWNPLGMAAPSVPLLVELISRDDIVYTPLDPITNPGVLQSSTDYIYVFVIDGIAHQSIYHSDVGDVCTSIEIDATAIVGATTVEAYRKVNNNLYKLNTDNALTFNDFEKELVDIPTGYAKQPVAMDDIVGGGVGMLWDGRAGVSLRALASNGLEHQSINLNFATGTITGDAETVSQYDIEASTRPPGQPGLPYFSI